jgi:hypothetical protein
MNGKKLILILILTCLPSFLIAEEQMGLQNEPELYLKHLKEFATGYRYKAGDTLKYKILLQTWKKKYVDEGPRGFKPDNYELTVQEEVQKIGESGLEARVSLKGRHIIEPLGWPAEIAFRDLEGEAYVMIKKNSWKTQIRKLESNPRDAELIKALLLEIVPQINQPIIFQEAKDARAFIPDNSTKGIEGNGWQIGKGETAFEGDMYCKIREFRSVKGFECAVFDTVIEIRDPLRGRRLVCGTIDFDYKQSRVVQLTYRINTVGGINKDFEKDYENGLLQIELE